jgi:2-dehydro-3-deoxygalactonokinase
VSWVDAGALDAIPRRGARVLELAGVRSQLGKVDEVALVSSGQQGELYRAALDVQGFTIRAVDAEAAARAGLWKAADAIWSGRQAS